MKRSADTSPLTERLAALGQVLRLRVCRLLERQELSVGEIARVVQLPQSTVSRHLQVLAGAGWVEKRAEGTATYYSLRIDDLDPAARSLWLAVRDQLEDRPTLDEDTRRLDAVLAERRTDSVSFFGRIAGEWDDVRGELFGSAFTAQALLALLPEQWVVADLGCGTGNAAELLAPHVREVIAVDRSGPMIEAARKRLAALSNVRFVEGDLTAIPLENGSIDAATCSLVLHHVPDPVAALTEVRRVLRPGGTVLVVDMFEHDRMIYRSTMGHQHLGFSPETVRQQLEAAGFADIRLSALVSDPDAKGPGLFAAAARAPGRSGPS